jgi:outer membrane protein OmpA-like peptidoglycan-associated protein
VNYRIVILFLLALSFQVQGQETTIINQFPDDGHGENYQLKQSATYTFVVNYYAPQLSPEEEAAALICSALNRYIDASYLIDESELDFNDEPALMMNEMSSIVNQGLALFQLNLNFKGFSDQIYDQLNKLEAIAWSPLEYELLGDNAVEREEMLRYFINVEFLDLKNQSENELAAFISSKKVLSIPDAWVNKMTGDEELAPPLSYKSEQFIAPLEFTLDEPTTSVDYEAEFSLPKQFVDEFNKKNKKKNKRKKDDFSESILALLEQNSEQLISIQRDLLEFKKENIERDREIKDENNSQAIALQEQIDDLKELIYADKRNPANLSVYEKALDLDKTVIFFDKSSADLSNQYKLELNKIFDILLKNPQLQIMITGYADKSGDPDFNAYISEKRATAVKSYLYKKGIANKRMLMNYLGDIASASENSDDRRVEVEFINNVGSIDLSAN